MRSIQPKRNTFDLISSNLIIHEHMAYIKSSTDMFLQIKSRGGGKAMERREYFQS